MITLEHHPIKARSCRELLHEFKEGKELEPKGIELKFLGVKPKDVYNISPPFFILIDGVETEVIAGRVEGRESFARSEAHFFKQQNEDTWVKINNAPVFPLEDPFVTTKNDEIIFGGVKVEHLPPTKDKKDPIVFNTVFYKGTNLNNLEEFAVGPEGMKDIRIIDLGNGKIGVFTRPRLGIYELGQIGYVEIDNLLDLNDPELLSKARIIEGLFIPDEWGGANQLHLLSEGRIGVIGHIAYRDEEENRHYYVMSFIYNPKNHTTTPVKIIATIDNFPKGEVKSTDLEDVDFPGGFDLKKSYLYSGLADARAGKDPIPFPF